ncbi:hypothetical protein SCUCBS95973_007341 [Sporothrix curviconia]|uniref:DJ-1/PfpI domain-containing protein n=1 Tax=Sporothrix curviconia TaxID=1260050 RepID=A0ABP0CD80_9PEZI
MSRFWSLLLCALCGLFVGSRATANIAPSSTSSAPLNFSYVLFPAFANIDVFAPVDGLALLSLRTQLNLFFLSDTLDPVSSEPQSAAMNAYNSSFGSTIVPTHTFDTAPPIDVLLVPGGLGTRAPAPQLDPHTAFIRNVYPSLQYIISICTGGGLLARQSPGSTASRHGLHNVFGSDNATWMANGMEHRALD